MIGLATPRTNYNEGASSVCDTAPTCVRVVSLLSLSIKKL